MTKTIVLYLEISFLKFNYCFLKIFSFRDFLEIQPPPFLKKEGLNKQTHSLNTRYKVCGILK